MSSAERLTRATERLIRLLERGRLKVVFAESCTAGLIAASLGRTPGVSEYLCGSAVVYREATKTAWLGVSAADLADPEITAVSPQVAEAMAVGVLHKTHEADLSASITGYLGPDSAPERDGVAFVAVAGRGATCVQLVRKIDLTGEPDRCGRQSSAAAQLLDLTADVIEQNFDLSRE